MFTDLFQRGSFRRIAGSAGLALALLVGCVSDFPNAIRNDEGEPIRLPTIVGIVTDDALTDEQKREALRVEGVDEDLIDLLIQQADQLPQP